MRDDGLGLPGSERAAVPAEPRARSISWAGTVPIAGVHAVALCALDPALFSWTGLVLALLGWQLFGSVGVTLTYHRLLAHRSFRTSKPVEHVLALIGVCALEGPPAQWVATHRIHHRHSDGPGDPHSPRQGLWWAHVGWMLTQETGAGPVAFYARDLLKDPFYRRLQTGLEWAKIYLLHALLFPAVAIAVSLASGSALADALRFGASVFVWGVAVRQLLVWHATWAINSLTHRFGYRNHATAAPDDSRNNVLVALLSAGEGFHNNHHHAPASACNWHRWWEVDQTYCLIKLLELSGLAHDVVEHRKRGEQTLNPGQGS
jgi:fatty-acid desaturase